MPTLDVNAVMQVRWFVALVVFRKGMSQCLG